MTASFRPDGTWSSRDEVTASLPEVVLSGVIEAINPSGCTALITVTSFEGEDPGVTAQVPLRLLEHAGGTP